MLEKEMMDALKASGTIFSVAIQMRADGESLAEIRIKNKHDGSGFEWETLQNMLKDIFYLRHPRPLADHLRPL